MLPNYHLKILIQTRPLAIVGAIWIFYINNENNSNCQGVCEKIGNYNVKASLKLFFVLSALA